MAKGFPGFGQRKVYFYNGKIYRFDGVKQGDVLAELADALRVYKQASDAGVAQLISGSLGELEAERVDRDNPVTL